MNPLIRFSQRLTQQLTRRAAALVTWVAMLAVAALAGIVALQIPDKPITEQDITSQEQRLNLGAINMIRSYREMLQERAAKPYVANPDPFSR